MRLAEKGHFAPPPALPKHAQIVSEHLALWPEVHARTHWLLGDETEVDGADFYLGDSELGHLHLDGEAHVAVPKKIRDALIAAGLAEDFRWSRKFVVFAIERASDVGRAEFLFKLSYDALRGVSETELLERVKETAPPNYETGRSLPEDAAARARAGR
jgi:hypothetical protein